MCGSEFSYSVYGQRLTCLERWSALMRQLNGRLVMRFNLHVLHPVRARVELRLVWRVLDSRANRNVPLRAAAELADLEDVAEGLEGVSDLSICHLDVVFGKEEGGEDSNMMHVGHLHVGREATLVLSRFDGYRKLNLHVRRDQLTLRIMIPACSPVAKPPEQVRGPPLIKD